MSYSHGSKYILSLILGTSVNTDYYSFMEGARLGSSVAFPRVAAQATVIEDHGEKISIKAGQEVMCNLVSQVRSQFRILPTKYVLGLRMQGFLCLP
jgi:hypothetical protein